MCDVFVRFALKPGVWCFLYGNRQSRSALAAGAFAARGARLFDGEFVSAAQLMCGPTSLTGDGALFLGIHCSKSPAALFHFFVLRVTL